MARLPGGFDSTGKERLGDFEPLKAGWYNAKIKESEYKDTKDKKGKMLVFQFEVLNKEHFGRIIFLNVNVENENEKAVEIADKTLATLCDACGVVGFEKTDEIHGIEMEIYLSIRPPTPQFPARNEVKNFRKLKGAATPERPERQESSSPSSSNSSASRPSKISFDDDIPF